MLLDHERLDVYRLALDFLVFAHQVIERLPRGRSHLCDQLTRASTSIVLNLAEGAGKHSRADKRRYYVSARGSATEAAKTSPLAGWLSCRCPSVISKTSGNPRASTTR